MAYRNICVLGGSGFVGQRLANRLCADGRRVRVLTRHRERVRDRLIFLPGLELIEADIHDPDQLAFHLRGCDAVVNLVGILNEVGHDGAGFSRAHTELTRHLVDACRHQGVPRLLQMSALNADPAGPSHYLRSKGEAENLALSATDLRVSSFRPSVIFGPGDSFFNRFAALLSRIPLLFPLACPNARFSPVFVGDVVEAMFRALDDPTRYGQRFELGGPETVSLRDVVELTARWSGHPRIILPLPDSLARLQAGLFDLTGPIWHLAGIEKPFSMDNFRSLSLDSVPVSNDLPRLGIDPSPMAAIVPSYLYTSRYHSNYDRYRKHARRDY